LKRKCVQPALLKSKLENADEAIKKVLDKIVEGELNTSNVEWDEPEYEDMSFDVTGDVD
jgi:hypothetical protein